MLNAAAGAAGGGAHPEDVEMMMRQTGITRSEAVVSLIDAGGDLVRAIGQLNFDGDRYYWSAVCIV